MVLQCWSSAPNLTNRNLSTLFLHSKPYNFPRFRKPRKPATLTCILKLGVEDIAEIASNKVVIAAGVSAAIGQLSKPYTCVLFYGKDFDFKTTFQAGGFPSTHSSSVVAAATSLALERGFSDSIFGLAVVYACLVMYDAQI
ncbi:ACID PHOSPHATASE/VANADIUM-DEPENDENT HALOPEROXIDASE-RELATED PROTEIN [Salix koriyanagi]|uniref:ACID PHOSPHATASE/VANADIUM-DEPENDENT HALOPEROXIDASE-RELATED PROTEIN n=1 Tax=Salix koriyanagi TaxID=2511006 RepID=A0A9Q0WSR9_9ROSI|nr:ACID PHOSPHATASE/VANADIUM-DEPENDENT HALOPEROXIDASE-RELATED PROTEIN [Salix koriyanagi]